MNASTSARPPWMTAMSALCALGVAFLVARDLAIPEVRDTEVWFGIALQGRAAQLTAPLHWALFAAGAWAYWTQRRWVARATAVYLGYVALSHAIWSALHPHAELARASLALATACLAAAILFWRAHHSAPAR